MHVFLLLVLSASKGSLYAVDVGHHVPPLFFFLMVNGVGAWVLCGWGFCICGAITRGSLSLSGLYYE